MKEKDTNILSKMLKEFAKLDIEKDNLEEKLKFQKQSIEQLEEKIKPVFTNTGLDKVNIIGLGTFSMEPKIYPRVEDEVKFKKWLGKNKLMSLVKETVHPSTLKGLVTERMKENKPYPDGVTVFTKDVVKFKK